MDRAIKAVCVAASYPRVMLSRNHAHFWRLETAISILLLEKIQGSELKQNASNHLSEWNVGLFFTELLVE